MSSSVVRSTFALYAPARPRSDETTNTAAAARSARRSSSGWSSVSALLVTSWTARVIWSAYARALSTRCWARRICEAAMSSIALVIFFVDCTPRMRRRSRRRRAPNCLPLVLRLAPDLLHLVLLLLALELAGFRLVRRLLLLARGELLLELLHRVAEVALDVLGQRPLLPDVLVELGVLVLQVVVHLGLEPPDVG